MSQQQKNKTIKGVPEDLWWEVKKAAAGSAKTVNEWLLEAIRRQLRAQEDRPKVCPDLQRAFDQIRANQDPTLIKHDAWGRQIIHNTTAGVFRHSCNTEGCPQVYLTLGQNGWTIFHEVMDELKIKED